MQLPEPADSSWPLRHSCCSISNNSVPKCCRTQCPFLGTTAKGAMEKQFSDHCHCFFCPNGLLTADKGTVEVLNDLLCSSRTVHVKHFLLLSAYEKRLPFSIFFPPFSYPCISFCRFPIHTSSKARLIKLSFAASWHAVSRPSPGSPELEAHIPKETNGPFEHESGPAASGGERAFQAGPLFGPIGSGKSKVDFWDFGFGTWSLSNVYTNTSSRSVKTIEWDPNLILWPWTMQSRSSNGSTIHWRCNWDWDGGLLKPHMMFWPGPSWNLTQGRWVITNSAFDGSSPERAAIVTLVTFWMFHWTIGPPCWRNLAYCAPNAAKNIH